MKTTQHIQLTWPYIGHLDQLGTVEYVMYFMLTTF